MKDKGLANSYNLTRFYTKTAASSEKTQRNHNKQVKNLFVNQFKIFLIRLATAVVF